MAQLIKQGNIFGRIGTGFGKGLAEQLPKEIERNRLSSGLRDLEKEGSNLSHIQQYAKLIESGATPEHINHILPFLRNASIAKGPRGSQGNQQENIDQNGNPINIPQQTGAPNQRNMKGPQGSQAPISETENPSTKRQAPEQAAKTTIVLPTPQQIDSGARQLMRDDPELYQGENGYANAYNQAKDRLEYPAKQQQEEINAGERQNVLQTRFENDFKKNFDTKVPRGIIPNDVEQRAMKRAEYNLSNGLSTEKSIQQETDSMQKMGKNLVTLNNSIGGRGIFGRGDELTKDIQKLRAPFAENNELELFKDQQKLALDIGDHFASENAWPLKKDQISIIKSIPKDSTPQEVAAQLSKTIDGTTSLFTLGSALAKANFDDLEIINAISELHENKIVKLEDFQQREASEYYPLNERLGLGDYLWSAFAGPVLSLPLQSAFNYVTGKKEKIGPVERFKRTLGKE